MDIQEALKWTNDLVFAKTGKHLDSLQRSILEGAWERQGYKNIAEDYHCTEDHVRKEAWKLWQFLSDVFEEDVKKSNVKAILENGMFSSISNVQIGNNINVCSENCPYPKAAKQHSTTNPVTPEKRYDLTDVPEADRFFNRTTEIATLKQWILEEKTRLIAIFGLPGIGKTALAIELLQQIKDRFDRIIWRSHTQFPDLPSLQTNLIQFLSENPTPTKSIIDSLRSHPTLIILDDLQETFTPGELSGSYLPGYQNYEKLCKQITETPHQSCWLLLSREKPIEIAALEQTNRRCRSLQLQGLGESAAEIFQERGLSDRDKWLELIQLYSGNPSWLKIIAATIPDLFHSSVNRFLSCSTLFLGNIEATLHAHFQRLSESEKSLMFWLASQEAAVDISGKPADFSHSEYDFWQALQSLGRRGLIEKITERSPSLADAKSLFALAPAIARYVKEQSSSSSGLGKENTSTPNRKS